MNPRIRKLQCEDVDRIYDLGMNIPEFSAKDEFGHRFWPKSTLELFVKQGLSFVVEDERLVIGFLLAVYQPITQKLTWENMYLAPSYQRRGLAEDCFQKSWEIAKNKGATIVEAIVASSNIPSQKMCKRLGFNNAGDYQWMLKWRD